VCVPLCMYVPRTVSMYIRASNSPELVPETRRVRHGPGPSISVHRLRRFRPLGPGYLDVMLPAEQRRREASKLVARLSRVATNAAWVTLWYG